MTDTVTPATIDQPHRVAFDVMAGIEPMTFLPGTTTDQITTRLRSAFLAADVIRDGQQLAAAIDVAEGTVVVSVDGCVIEHGSITAIEPAPKPTAPDRLLNAEPLRAAVVLMAIRYGNASMDYAYAVADGRDSHEQERLHGTKARRFAALQRLTRALANLAGGAR